MKYYLGYYSCEKIKDEKRFAAPAAENKMGYVISALNEVGEDIVAISPAETTLCKFVKGQKTKIEENVLLKTFPSFSSKNKIVRILGHLLTRMSLFLYLLKNIKREDHLIVYHSLVFMKVITFLKKIKKFKLTIEVEELYSDVLNDATKKPKELSFFSIADGYIFVNDLLNKEINIEQKPSAVVYGTYRSVRDLEYRFDDNKIHVVYAGTFKQGKGVETAISIANHLDENYVLEILGRGTEAEIENVKQKVAQMSTKTKCKVNYVGFKSGDAFNSYIQACHIGLSPQQADAKFNATSFPSKVLMYMSNGLRVVSVKIPAIETSDVGKYIYYYENQDPQEIAKAIKSVDFSDDYDSREILHKLHLNFVEQLKTLL